MKFLKVFVAAAAICCFGGHAVAADGSDGFNLRSYSRISASFASTDFDGTTANGFGIGYVYGFSLSNTLPFHLETGLNFDMRFRDNVGTYPDFGVTRELDLTTTSLTIPVSLTYNVCLNSEKKIAFIPAVGFDIRCNLSADAKSDVVNGENKSFSMFDDDMGGWTHFQTGWHIGGGIQFNKFYIGARYGRDFINLAEDLKTSTATISAAVMF